MNEITNIPKILHLVWLGDGMPNGIEKLIGDIKDSMSDYQVFLWDETFIDIDSSPFLKKCYEAKKYAFVADYIRLKALKMYGGVYLDIDNKVVTKLDDIFTNDTVLGFEKGGIVSCSFMASIPNSLFINKLLKEYERVDREATDLIAITLPDVMTKLVCDDYAVTADDEKFQRCKDIDIYPKGYFSSPSKESKVIHLFLSSWTNDKPLSKVRKQIAYYVRKNTDLWPVRVLYQAQQKFREKL